MTFTDLDALDERLLSLLEEDASRTNADLAEKAHASPATCLRRVKRLVDLGVIQKQVAILDPAAFGPTLSAIVEVTLSEQGDEHQAAFAARAREEQAVLQCYRVSPGPDFVLVVQVRDMPEYHAFAQRLLAARTNVRNVRSFFVVERSKFETRLPR